MWHKKIMGMVMRVELVCLLRVHHSPGQLGVYFFYFFPFSQDGLVDGRFNVHHSTFSKEFAY